MIENTQTNKSGLYSHPNVYIEDHINNCLQILKNQEYISNIPYDCKPVVYFIVALHDFGKCTMYFQKYIQSNFKYDNLKNHAYLSALYTLYSLSKFFNINVFNKNSIENLSIEQLLMLIYSFVAVGRHHTRPQNFENEIISRIETEGNIIEKQIKTLNINQINIFIKNLEIIDTYKKHMYLDDTFTQWITNTDNQTKHYKAFLQSLGTQFRKFKRNNNRTDYNLNDYILSFSYFQYLFSVLLSVDKLEAGVKTTSGDKILLPQKRICISSRVVDDYKKACINNQDSGINNLREEAYNDILNAINKADLNNKIYTITLPTGIGKTLIGFKTALRLRERIYEKTHTLPRIIYALPFISIIDQNANVYEKILRQTFNNINDGLLIKHHHLSEPSYQDEDILNLSYSSAKLLTEGWEGEIIITTFIQFFYTLISREKEQFRRFNKLTNSIILLDEIQSIPPRYWFLIEKTLKNLAENFNSYIILMTATQPYIFTDNTIELASEEIRTKIQNKIDRVNIHINLKPQTIENFIETLSIEDNKKYLFVMNTISSSREIYEKLKNKYSNKSKSIGYLSTYITPHDRKKRIASIDEYDIVVSTQLVEAGVDIDFDIVYRDFAPLDSIVQSAGRCNRHQRKEKGNVYIIRLINDNGKPYANKIYDSTLLSQTINILKEKHMLTEKDLNGLLNQYFRILRDEAIKQDEEIIKAIQFFNFDDIEKFELIQDQPYKQDVFVPQNKEAEEILDTVKDIFTRLKNKQISLFTAREEFDKIKSKVYEYVVSVKKEEIIIDEKYKDIPFAVLDITCYDKDIGVIKKDANISDFII